MRVLDGLREVAADYDGMVCDLWGVVHDGQSVFAGAAAALAALRDAGVPVVFLTNAPRRAAPIEAQLAALGIERSLYRAAMSSGEAAWQLLRDRHGPAADPWFARLGARALHLGLERDRSVCEGVGLERVADPARAEFVLNTGPDPERGRDSERRYDDLLAPCAARRLPMLCVNPDRSVVTGGREVLCAGALADRYRALGCDDVREIGKPDPAIYAPTLDRLGLGAGARVLALGDGPRTDLAGAAAAGLDCLWVLEGLSASLDPLALDGLAEAAGVRPLAALRGLHW